MKHTSLILLLLFLAVLLLVGSCSRTEAAPAPTEAAAEAVEVITTAPPETLPHTTLPPETEPPEETQPPEETEPEETQPEETTPVEDEESGIQPMDLTQMDYTSYLAAEMAKDEADPARNVGREAVFYVGYWQSFICAADPLNPAAGQGFFSHTELEDEDGAL